MALIKCHNCGKGISSYLKYCPYCKARTKLTAEESTGHNDSEDSASEREKNTSADPSAGIPADKKPAKKRLRLSFLIAILLCAGALALYYGCDGETKQTEETITPTPEPLPYVSPDSDSIPEQEQPVTPRPDSIPEQKQPVTPQPDSIPEQIQPVTPLPDSIPPKKLKPEPKPKPVVETGEDCYTIAEIKLYKNESSFAPISIPYGSKMLRFKYDSTDSAKVRYGRITGFVNADHILSEEDFRLFESIFSNRKVLEAIPQASFRRAILVYYKGHHTAGRLTDCVLLKRIFPGSSRYEDMAILIEELNSDRRKIVVFERTDDGEIRPVLEDRAQPAPYKIADVSASRYNLTVRYTHSSGDSVLREKTVVYDEYHGRYLRR